MASGTGYVLPRAAGAFMPGFGGGGEVAVTPVRGESAALTPKTTEATVGSPPCTPASHIIPRSNTGSLEEPGETKDKAKGEAPTLDYELLRAPTMKLDDTHPETLQDPASQAPTPVASEKDISADKAESIASSSPYLPDNQLGLEPDHQNFFGLTNSPTESIPAVASPKESMGGTPAVEAPSAENNEAANTAAAASGTPAAPSPSEPPSASQPPPQSNEPATPKEGGDKPVKTNKYKDGTYWKILECTIVIC